MTEIVSLRVQPSAPVVVKVGVAGIQGPRGDAGAAGLDRVTGTSRVPMSALKVVSEGADGYYLTNPALEASLSAVRGIALSACAAHASCEVRTSGVMSDPSWSFLPNAPLFAGSDASLTQSPPVGPLSRIIGFALTPTTIVVDIQPLYFSETI